MLIFLLSFALITPTDLSSARKFSGPGKSRIFFSALLIYLYMKIIRKKNHSSHLITENEAEDLYPVIHNLSITMKSEERETTKQEDYLQLNKQTRSL